MLYDLVLVVVAVAVIMMWQQLAELRMRLDALEPQPRQSGWHIPAAREELHPAGPPEERTVVPPVEQRVERMPSPPSIEPESAPQALESEPPEPVSARPGFEELFGRRLPIWAGGITLAVAGGLIVRFSIDTGLLPPVVRVLCGLLFGALLIGGAELAHRNTDRVRDPRVAQALAGSGIASCYASILIAANLYHLVQPLIAFAGLAGVTASAMGLALRFGASSALLGLLGGLAAPALVGGGPADIPLLATYLALLVGGLCAVSRRQRWAWLGISSLLGGFGWGGILIMGGLPGGAAPLSIGLYLLALGLAFPLLFAADRRGAHVRVASSLIAALEIAALVASGGFAMLDWGLFGLISLGMLWLARRDTRLAGLPALGLAVALALIALWPQPNASAFAVVLIGTVLIYGGAALAGLWRASGTIIEAAQVAALGLAALILSLLRFHTAGDGHDALFGGLALLCAGLPAGAAMLGWRNPARKLDARFALLATAAAILVAAAALLALPVWLVPACVAAVGFATLLVGHAADDDRLEASAWALAGAAIMLLPLDARLVDELLRACGHSGVRVEALVAVARWAALAAALTGFAWRGRQPTAIAAAQAAAILAGYVAIAQVVPPAALPPVTALGLPLLAGWSRGRADDQLLPAMVAVAGLLALWALQPFDAWLAPAIASLTGQPMLVASLPGVEDCLLRLLVPAVAIAAALAVIRTNREARAIGAILAAAMGGVAVHALYKRLFALGSIEAFVRSGLAERTIWEALLFGVAVLAWRLVPRRPRIAIGLAAAALAHAGWYSILLHDPLWSAQATGAVPILNWLLPAYALPLLILWSAGRAIPAQVAGYDRARSIAQMLLILLLGFSELRQAFHGPLLTTPGVTAAEDVLRSVVAIGLAIGFLLWGIARASRDWRIGSLLLMLAAVAKVFLVDAAGLDGLARIASFVALGFSLIGIGWLYSHRLEADQLLTARQ